MNGREPMKNLWSVSRAAAGLVSVHRLALHPGRSAPICKESQCFDRMSYFGVIPLPTSSY